MKRKLIVFSLILVLLLTACSSASYNENAASVMPGYALPEMESDVEAPAEQSADSLAGGKSVERLVIQNASMEVSVADPAAAMQATADLATRLGGYVVSSTTWANTYYNEGTYRRGTITIRIPAESLEKTMQEIRLMSAIGQDGVISESISGQDVTSDFVDSESRLRNLEAAEEQLMVLMENTSDLEQTLAVFRELTSVREQIEVLQGHLNYLRESSDTSSISVTFVAEASLQPINVGGWQLDGVVKDAVETLVSNFRGLVNFLVRFGIVCLPILIPVGVVVYFIIKAIRKNKAKRSKKVDGQIIDEESKADEVALNK